MEINEAKKSSHVSKNSVKVFWHLLACIVECVLEYTFLFKKKTHTHTHKQKAKETKEEKEKENVAVVNSISGKSNWI